MRKQILTRHRPVAIPFAGSVGLAALSVASSSVLGIALAVGLLAVAGFRLSEVRS